LLVLAALSFASKVTASGHRYFTISREQFRIRGKLRVVGPEFRGPGVGDGAVDLAALRVAAWSPSVCMSSVAFIGSHALCH
jgi:hypothetical protein